MLSYKNFENIVESASKETSEDAHKYTHYHDFSGSLMYLKDHQVLAIRRGVKEKALQMNYEIDGTKMEKSIFYHLRTNQLVPSAWLEDYKSRSILQEGIHDAWTRLMRRRGTTRLWADKTKEAQDRAVVVFEENLRRALLEPPFLPPTPVLALDPGFQAGIKCAILDKDGAVETFQTVKFLGNKKVEALDTLGSLLAKTQLLGDPNKPIVVALGNGHGSKECRELIQEASQKVNTIDIDINLVNEAGASVWSVTETAQKEFPKQAPASIAAASIGRRLQNPLHELVKVPPRSLGLGMYQHDISEKELDESLHLTSIDAVATVGVDVNSCSLEILQQVPGLSKLAKKVIHARPIACRHDLLKVSGLGPKTFEQCSAFCKVFAGPEAKEPLDSTLVHPESYDLARWLLQRLSWNLNDGDPTHFLPKILPQDRNEWKQIWSEDIAAAAANFNSGSDRVFSVLQNVIDSIRQVDPRLENTTTKQEANSVKGCKMLSADLTSLKDLHSAVPVRGILGTVRNIADFGAFVDFGAENDGLLHKSKLGGSVALSSLLIGEQIPIDVIDVDLATRRVSLAMHGTNAKAPTTTKKGVRGAVGKGTGKRSFASYSRIRAKGSAVRSSKKRKTAK